MEKLAILLQHRAFWVFLECDGISFTHLTHEGAPNLTLDFLSALHRAQVWTPHNFPVIIINIHIYWLYTQYCISALNLADNVFTQLLCFIIYLF